MRADNYLDKNMKKVSKKEMKKLARRAYEHYVSGNTTDFKENRELNSFMAYALNRVMKNKIKQIESAKGGQNLNIKYDTTRHDERVIITGKGNMFGRGGSEVGNYNTELSRVVMRTTRAGISKKEAVQNIVGRLETRVRDEAYSEYRRLERIQGDAFGGFF